MNIASAVILCTIVGAVGAIILVAAAKFMAVEEDPRIEEVAACLAGANCGGCGYAGCSDYAKAVVIRRPGPTADAHSIFPKRENPWTEMIQGAFEESLAAARFASAVSVQRATDEDSQRAVSYTHLTLPTNREV